ncbi:hypothetical protein ACVC7V_09535 [Hydrogenophaga sp. A37]|uniref:hypothetical protein n=1 Tax=Hydrogenophaga sp. A37 TaxID=1945864 RepID=UPI000985535C|nr:hypothetical protein [Hydrogenophaga sp. A37]OOG80049.1 hypothetical protein B0E41_21650 [Hydrogenophaga sp. A37]
MTYTLKLYVSDDTTPAQRQAAERLFRQALETALGDAAMVVPVYSAYLNIVGQHGEAPDTEALTLDERLVLETWQQAETAAMEAVFGPHRHLDEGGYQIVLPS